jgi:hypothetical protein
MPYFIHAHDISSGRGWMGDPVKLDKLSAHFLLFLGILFLCTKQLAPLYWCVPSTFGLCYFSFYDDW